MVHPADHLGSARSNRLANCADLAQAPQPPSNNSCFPEHLSFLVRIENLRPDYSKQSIRHSTGCWVPPTNPEAYELVGPSVLLRWQGGRMGSVPSDVRIQDARLYSAATMFTQEPDTHHLLAVGFDARTARVHRENGWRPITFNHEPAPDFVNGQFYSFLSTAGGEARIAAPGSPSWMPQLLPRHYNYRTAADAQNIPTHAGLIGDLPLLFALAVFSAPSNSAGFRTALASIRPGGWHHHQFENSEGREIELFHSTQVDC